MRRQATRARLSLVTATNTTARYDTVMMTPAMIAALRTPPFQRPVRINEKMRALVEWLKREGGVLPGLITLGYLRSEPDVYYVADGQHRLEAGRMTELPEIYADVKYEGFDSMQEMAERFRQLNGSIARMRPDDILRAMAMGSSALGLILRECPYVGFDMVRRGGTSPVLSMSMLLRAWRESSYDVPRTGGDSATDLAHELTDEDAQQIVAFLDLCFKAWGRDAEYFRLWGALNMVICAWLYRRVVLVQWSAKVPKMSPSIFLKCLMSLSASRDYLDWLVGRNISERDRSPCYGKIKSLFVKRVEIETGAACMFPSPPWASGASYQRRRMAAR